MRFNDNVYFSDYDSLRDHFKDEHFLCTEGDCVNEQFTSAFRSEIDLKGKILKTFLFNIQITCNYQLFCFL